MFAHVLALGLPLVLAFNFAIAPSALAARSPDPSPGAKLVSAQVSVAIRGAVKRPGLYRLPAGSRVAEAIAAAGGPTRAADLADMALAQAVSDGETWLVPVQGPVVSAKSPRSRTPARPTKRRHHAKRAKSTTPKPAIAVVNLNRADVAALDTLPGIGPARAQEILRVRARLGRFRSLDDLREVQGLGPKRIAKLKPHVRL